MVDFILTVICGYFSPFPLLLSHPQLLLKLTVNDYIFLLWGLHHQTGNSQVSLLGRDSDLGLVNIHVNFTLFQLNISCSGPLLCL